LVLGCVAIAGLTVPQAVDREVASGRANDPGPAGAPAEAGGTEYGEIRWRRSVPIGEPSRGRLEHGVQLPAEGKRFFTWDPILRQAPNRPWRRWGAHSSLRVLLRVLAAFSSAHSEAPRIGVGDLSRPWGGDFGPRFGLPGHASHQNGLDIDIYYPRLDRAELAPARVAQIDRRLSQDLVRRFVRAGAVYVFVGPLTGLTGPSRIVQRLPHHDNHMHVRLPPAAG
jgi:murein endopeptidase